MRANPFNQVLLGYHFLNKKTGVFCADDNPFRSEKRREQS
jgi:hypothetical protein